MESVYRPRRNLVPIIKRIRPRPTKRTRKKMSDFMKEYHRCANDSKKRGATIRPCARKRRRKAKLDPNTGKPKPIISNTDSRYNLRFRQV